MTGAGGRIGRILQAGWANDAAPGIRPYWTGRGKFSPVPWDMSGEAVPKGLPRGAVVLHLAGVTKGSETAFRANVDLVPPLLQLCQSTGARRLLFMSSAAVYPPGALNREDGPLAPAGDYGRSKVAAEALVCAQSHTPVTILRAGNIAGADALLGPRPSSEIILDQVADQSGGPLRSWIGARVLAKALSALCQLDLPPVLNLAQDPPLRMSELLQAAELRWRYGPTPAAVPVATQDLGLLHALLPLPPATPTQLVTEAAWAREVLA